MCMNKCSIDVLCTADCSSERSGALIRIIVPLTLSISSFYFEAICVFYLFLLHIALKHNHVNLLSVIGYIYVLFLRYTKDK